MKSSSRTSVQTLSAHGLTWTDVENPTAEVLRDLQKQYRLHPLDLEDVLSPAQRPKLEVHEHYVFLVFRFPARTNSRLHGTELDVFLSKDHLLTFHTHDLQSIRTLLSDAKLFPEKQKQLLSQGPDYLLYEILSAVFEQNYALTDRLSQELDRIESRIFEHGTRHRNVLFDISNIRRNILDLRKVFKPQAGFLKQIATLPQELIKPERQIFWRNLIEIAENQLEIAETQLSTIEGLADTNDSLVNHRLNEIFRLLTIISVLFLPSAFLLDVVGTDTPGNPLPERTLVYGVILAALFVAEIAFLVYLRKRKVL